MTWRTVRRYLRRHGLWPKASRDVKRRNVRRWAVTEIGPGILAVDYESDKISVCVLIPNLDQANRARLRRAIASRLAELQQQRAWLERRAYEPSPLTYNTKPNSRLH